MHPTTRMPAEVPAEPRLRAPTRPTRSRRATRRRRRGRRRPGCPGAAAAHVYGERAGRAEALGAAGAEQRRAPAPEQRHGEPGLDGDRQRPEEDHDRRGAREPGHRGVDRQQRHQHPPLSTRRLREQPQHGDPGARPDQAHRLTVHHGEPRHDGEDGVGHREPQPSRNGVPGRRHGRPRSAHGIMAHVREGSDTHGSGTRDSHSSASAGRPSGNDEARDTARRQRLTVISASLRRSSTSVLGDLADLLRRGLLDQLRAGLGERTGSAGRPHPTAPACCLTCVVERAQLLLGRLDRAVLVRDELLDHELGLDLPARLLGAHALLLDGRQQLLAGPELVLRGEVVELGVDVLVADLDAARLGLLRQQLGVDEVVDGLLLQRVLVGRLAGRLRLRGGLLELRLVDRDELVLGDLLAVDLGDDVRDPLEVGPGGGVGVRAGGGAVGRVLLRAGGVAVAPAAGGEGQHGGRRGAGRRRFGRGVASCESSGSTVRTEPERRSSGSRRGPARRRGALRASRARSARRGPAAPAAARAPYARA